MFFPAAAEPLRVRGKHSWGRHALGPVCLRAGADVRSCDTAASAGGPREQSENALESVIDGCLHGNSDQRNKAEVI